MAGREDTDALVLVSAGPQMVAAPGDPLRAIEQALFMIGYDLGSDAIAAVA